MNRKRERAGQQAALNFGDEAPSGHHQVVPMPDAPGAPLTPEQKRYRKLSKQVAATREALERFREQMREFGQRQADATRPLVAEMLSCREVLLRAMEAFLGAQKLTPSQRKTLRRSIAEEASDLIALMDDKPPGWIVEIHDRYAAQTHAHQVQEEKLSMQSMLAEALGEDLGEALLSDEELARRLAQVLAQEAAGADEQGAPGRPGPNHDNDHDNDHGSADGPAGRPQEARPEGRRGRPSAKMQQQAAQAEQFTQSVREVYRKLASTLHPDRAPEGPRRDAMTAMMQEANKAYEAHDLLTLLDLQARLDSHAAGSATHRVMGLSATTLRHYNLLLDRELRDLRQALQQERLALVETAPYVNGFMLSRSDLSALPAVLKIALQDELQALRDQIDTAQESLKSFSNAAAGRRWLAQERQNQREHDRTDRAFDRFLDHVLDEDLPEDITDDDFDRPYAPPRGRRRRAVPPDDIPF
jgi:hypothetical protein